MKDIVIKASRIRRELWVALGCFLTSFAVNAGAVIAYAKPWYELFTQIGYVCIIALAIWIVLLVLRVLYVIIKKIIKRV